MSTIGKRRRSGYQCSSGLCERMDFRWELTSLPFPSNRDIGGERLCHHIRGLIPSQRDVCGNRGGSQEILIGNAGGELEIRIDFGGLRGIHQGLWNFCRRKVSRVANDVGIDLGTVPGIFHSQAIGETRKAVVVVRDFTRADGPWDPVVPRCALNLLPNSPVETAIVARGREKASPPEGMVTSTLVESLPAARKLLPFQLLLPRFLEVEIEILIKGQLNETVVVIPSGIVTAPLGFTSSPFLRLHEICQSFEASCIVNLAIVVVPNRGVVREVSFVSEAIIGVRRPQGSVMFRDSELNFGMVIFVAPEGRQMMVHGIGLRKATGGKNGTSARGYQSR